jgi:hypothetical protein
MRSIVRIKPYSAKSNASSDLRDARARPKLHRQQKLTARGDYLLWSDDDAVLDRPWLIPELKVERIERAVAAFELIARSIRISGHCRPGSEARGIAMN